MLAESEVGARREANRKRMRSPTIILRADVGLEPKFGRRCPVPVAR
jgi:hypothetical protein